MNRRFVPSVSVVSPLAALFVAMTAYPQGVVGWGVRGFSNIDSLDGGVSVAASFGATVVVKSNGPVACFGNGPFNATNRRRRRDRWSRSRAGRVAAISRVGGPTGR